MAETTTQPQLQPPWTILKVLGWTQQRFQERRLPTPRLDAEVLLAHVLGMDRVGLYTHHDQPLAKEELGAFRELIKRRLGGEPVAYLVGRKEFWSLSLRVDERVLVPRPETEGVVEAVLGLVTGRPSPRVADIGTGSGAIALAVAHERPDAEVLAVDRSPEALAVAHENAEALDLDVELLEGDLLAPLQGRGPFDVIASNPPYIPDAEWATLQLEVRREPRQALLGGPDGLDLIRRLVAEAPALLRDDGGALVLEVGAGQAPEVIALATSTAAAATAGGGATEGPGATATAPTAGPWREATARRDLAGIERVVVLKR